MRSLCAPNKRVLMLGIIAVLLVLLLAGCGGGSKGSQDSSAGDGQGVPAREKIIILSASDVPNIDPGVGQDYGSTTALINMYDTLVFPDHDGNIKPWLATDWKASEDGLTWTFQLRQGVKFHNGDELTAEDVVFSMERLLAMGEGFAFLFTDLIKEAKAKDAYTVEFTLNKPFGPFLSIINRLFVLNKKQVLANLKPGPYGEMGDYGKDWLVTNDAGSGPYMVKELKMQEHLYAVKYDDFWGGWDKDAPDAFKIVGTTEASTLRTMMTRRELDITDQWQTEESLKGLEQINGVGIATFSSGAMYDIMLNTKKPPTDDVHFRKALCYAFDYKTVLEKLFPAQTPAIGPVDSAVPGHNPNLYQYTFNIEKAKEELAKSKYANNPGEYPVEFMWNTVVPDQEKIALLFQSTVEQLGINVNITKAPWLSYIDLVASPETTPNVSIVIHDLLYDEAGAMLESRYHSKSTGTFQQAEWLQDPTIDALIEDALSTVNKEERFAKYQVIQEKIVDLAPTIWAFEQAERRAYQEGDWLIWPTIERVKQGLPVTRVMPYNFYFADFKVYPEKMPK